MVLVMLAYLAFLSIALPDSMLGVAWPSMRLAFDQSLGAAGVIPPFGVAATIVSTLATRHVVARIGIGRLLVLSTTLSAAGLAISAASPSLEVFLVGVVVLGLSGGAIDVTLNAYAARHFGPRRISFMHASYVVGAAASPALVTIALQVGASWRWPYAFIAVLQLLLAGIFAAGATRWQSGDTHASGLASRTARRTRLLTIPSSVGIGAVVLQTGIESSAALWAYSFLTLSAGVTDGVAGFTVSGFWLMMFVSRVVLGSLAERIGSWTTMSVGAVGLVVAAVLTTVGTVVPGAALIGVLLFGLAAGPMYPLLIATTADRTTPTGVDRLVAAQSAASAVGAATLPLLLGIAMNASPGAFASIMATAAVVAGLLHLALRVSRSMATSSIQGRLPMEPGLSDAGLGPHRPHHEPQALLGPAGVIWTFVETPAPKTGSPRGDQQRP